MGEDHKTQFDQYTVIAILSTEDREAVGTFDVAARTEEDAEFFVRRMFGGGKDLQVRAMLKKVNHL